MFNDGKYPKNSIFNKSIILTPNISVLSPGTNFDKPLVLQPNIKILTFGRYLNQSIILTKNIMVITFGFYFDKPLFLTSNITHLTLGCNFNELLALTKNTKHLTLKCYGSGHPLILNKNITHLRGIFRDSIILTPRILYFRCEKFTNSNIILTENIVHLTIDGNPNTCLLDTLPDSLKKFPHNIYDVQFNNLPCDLTVLKLHY